MNRRSFLRTSPAAAAGLAAIPLGAQTPDLGKSKLKITGIRVSVAKPRLGTFNYKPAPGAWSTQDVEVASPMSLYPKYKATRSLFNPDPGKLEDFAVEIATGKGISGRGVGGRAGGLIVEDHLSKLLMGEDPFDVERLWDIMWRSTMSYGRKGVTMNAISGVDIALWDIIGKALNMPVYKLLGGQTKDRIPCYCTGNDFDQHVEFGFKRLKLAIPHGPADGLAGMKKNEEVVKQARKAVGPEGDIMLDCWMSWTERYTIEMAQMLEPYRIYWMEEVLQPHDYAGFGRLRKAIKSTRIVTGEHEYGRYGFRELLEHESAEIWQPDAQWCGGLTELRKIGALAAAYDIPVIPHAGGLSPETVAFTMATTNAPWCELFMPPPGGPKEVYQRFEERMRITRGPEGIYMQPQDAPGLGWDVAKM
jgi:L-rhamnonate dehydratase